MENFVLGLKQRRLLFDFLHQASFTGNLVWSDMKGFVRLLRILMQAPDFKRCTTQSMKVKSCHALGRRLWKVFCLCSCPIGHWVRRSVFGRKHNCQFFGQNLPQSFSTLHCTQSIQLENDDSTDRIHLLRVTQMKSPQFKYDNGYTYIKQAKLQELRCAGIFGIWWAPAVMPVIGVFLDENYRPPSHFHDWDTRASNSTKTLGRLN